MSKSLLLLVIVLFIVYIFVYKRMDKARVQRFEQEEPEEPTVINSHKARIYKKKEARDYLLPQVYSSVNTKIDRINKLRHDLTATGLARDNDPHNLRAIHDDLLIPEVTYEQPAPTNNLKVVKPAYTPDWHRHPQQNATLHVLNYQRYENSNQADADGIEPYDSTQSMNNVFTED